MHMCKPWALTHFQLWISLRSPSHEYHAQIFLNTSTLLTPSSQLSNSELNSEQYFPCLWMLGHPPFRGSSNSAIMINILVLNYMASFPFDITIPTSTQPTSRLM